MKVAAVPVTILSVDATPINPEPSPKNVAAVTELATDTFVAVTMPEKLASPYTFKVAPVPTFMSEVVVTPEIISPFETVGAPFAAVFVIVLTRILPAEGPPPNVPKSANPRTSGIKSSPSAMIKSALLSTLISAYCVYALDEDAGTSTVMEDGTPRT